MLRPELAAVIGAERFLREIKTIANLQHPHILRLIDSGEVDGTAYYVMPFVEGESLRDRLNREKQLPIGDASGSRSEVAAALDYAHRHGVIHRDIKPENVMLHDGSALVADFGIALAVSSAGGSRMTETGMSLGTPHYMSPEQAMGEREITARSDVYALGAMTYEMLLGEPPFTGPTAQAIVAKVMTEEPPPTDAAAASIPPDVEDAVLTALEKLPADRFGTAAEFAAALHDGKKERRKTTGAGTSRESRYGRAARWRRAWSSCRSRHFCWAGGAASPLRSPHFWPVDEGDLGSRPLKRCLRFHRMGRPSPMPAAHRPACGCSYAPSPAGGALALTDDTTQTQSHPRWSPDGSRVLFLQGGGVFSVPATGGAERPEVPPGRIGPVIGRVVARRQEHRVCHGETRSSSGMNETNPGASPGFSSPTPASGVPMANISPVPRAMPSR